MVFFHLRRQIILPRDKSLGKTPSAVQILTPTPFRRRPCVGVWARASARRETTTAGDRTTARHKNNIQLATGVTKAGGGRQESVENHTSTTTCDDGSVQ